ncbi:Ig-like domain-containing protein [Sulfitobacter sp. F26169L]|uniref:Ig-like domain-containing protein n=1 Tax=Sulfitobacter sp. F26169L TaxID=2996015 RepID=UPI002260CEF8|nr:Ig-like domain-containing protein [Sulfitobacter sp. F26169L]MCX7564766.1 Ig-like domain-containing protein [Sulfitobacter sp. F26169L]
MQRGTVAADVQDQVIVAGAGQEISINARQSDFASQVRSGDKLVISLADGRTITIDNFFNDAGEANRLFVSADGYLNEVSFIDQGQGNLHAQYGPTAEWGKWSPSDELIFLGNSEVAGVPLPAGGADDVSMLGAALLGGSGLFGSGAAIAAGLGGAAVLGSMSGGGDDGPADPYVNDEESNVVIGGDDADESLTITGGGEPGDDVTVTVGDKTVGTVIDDDGKFEAVFDGENFPDDGVYDSTVTVTNGDGDETDLGGPSFEIDTTAPEIVFTSGTESTGDFFNEASFAEGVTITGTGEAGATLDVTINGNTQSTVVGEDGGWTVSWEAGAFEAGEYTTGVTVVATDSFGNSGSYTETLVIDTVTSVTVDTAAIGGDGTINGVEHTDGVSFSGTAQAGSSVEVTVAGTTHTVIATETGTWSATFTSSELAVGEYTGTVTVVATDVHGNVASTSGTYDLDTLVRDFSITSSTGGSDGVINAEEAAQPLTVSGMTEPGSSVTVALGEATATAVVAADGSWTATFAAGSVAAGTYTATMTATATDAAGNIDTATTSVVVDTDAGVLTIDSAPVEGDDIVNEAEASDGVVLTGTADAGAVVTVTMEGVSHNVVAKADGTWEAFFSASDVAAGVYTAEITATTTDAYGNSRSASDSVEVDTRVDNLGINANDIGVDNIISGAEHGGSVTVTGSTEVGSTAVVVTLGGQTASATVDAAGKWSAVFNGSALETGTYTADVGVTATDAAGNVKTAAATVDVDTEVVPFDMTSNSAGTDQVVNAAEAAAGIDLGGSVEAGSTVVVTFDGKPHNADVDTAGNWSLTIDAADIRSGTYDAEISVEATDHVGNKAVINDILSIDTDAPDGPIIKSFTEGSDGFRGISIETVMENGEPTTDVQSVVQVAADGSISEVQGEQGTNSRGETTFEFAADVPNGSQLIVNATDLAGNTSGTYLVLDDEAATDTVDLTNMALGDFQIENLDLDFAEAASVVIDEASLLALSTATNTLTIRGSAEDLVTIQGGEEDGTREVDGQTFNVYNVGDEGTLLIEQEVPVII